MRRAVLIVLFTLAWTIGPVMRVGDEPVQPVPSPVVTISR